MRTLFPANGRMTRLVLSLSTAAMLSGAVTAAPMFAAAQSQADIIAQLQAQITALQAQLSALIGGGSAPAGKCTFTRDLTLNVTGEDVRCLQRYLNSAGHQLAASGAGSPGNETTFFGQLTRGAVSKWQAANGVSPTAGYFGPLSRAKYDSVVVVTPPTPTTPTPPGSPTGTSLFVSSGTQPGAQLAPLGAARVPATVLTLRAGTDGDVQVKSITVERQGPSSDSTVSGVILLDENGLQIGLSKTLNSNHQAVLNSAFTVRAGTTKTVTVAINRPATGADGGNVARMSVLAVDASPASVSGSLPVEGGSITMNSTLSIGTATLSRGVNDPGSSQTKEIGTTGYIFSAVRVTSGSNEDVLLNSVSFNQSGSAGSTDLENVKVVLDGTEYPAVVSSDGKYYTATFGSGITITKGNQKEFYIKGDIISGSNRGIDFDIYRFTDVYVVGKSFGYGITPTASDAADSQTDDDSTFDDGDVNPIWDASEVTVGNGTIVVSKATSIPAQNVAINLEDQNLGGFDVEVKGEGVTVAQMVFNLSRNSSGAGPDGTKIDNVKLIDNTTGQVVAGPKDNGSGTITFTDSVTFPVGKRSYVLKGKLTTDWSSDQTIAASTTPSSNWTSITGASSGASITASPASVLTGNTMTVKSGAVSVALSSSPTAQTVIRGVQGFTFANVIFDATASGEDLRFTTARFQYFAGNAADLTGCQLFDGTTALNNGSNVEDPTAEGEVTFTLDSNLTVPKNSSKTVALKCNVSSSGTGDYGQFTLAGDEYGSSAVQATGLTSGSTVNPTVASSTVSNKMTFAGSGSLTIALDSSSPSVALAQAGQELTLAVLRFTASNEAMDVKQLALQLNNTASNTPADLVKLTLWDGSTKVGEVTATSSDTGLIATISNFLVPKDGTKLMTIKGQLSNIGNNEAGRPGHLVTVDYDDVVVNGNSATYAVGQGSSSNEYVTSSDTASAGVRGVRAYPTLSVLSIPSTSLADASQKVLHRFSVSAPSGTNGVSLYKFTFSVATSGDEGIPDFTVTNLRLYAFTSSSFTGGKYTSDGQVNNGSTLFSTEGGNDGIEADRATSTDKEIYFNPASPTSASPEAISISAGETVYFELRGDVSGADTGDSMTVQLMGDNAWFPAVCGGGGTVCSDDGFVTGSIAYAFATSAPYVDNALIGSSGGGAVTTGGNSDASGSGDDFIWSGNSTTTHSGAVGAFGPDWYNGFVVPGLPSSGASAVTLTL